MFALVFMYICSFLRIKTTNTFQLVLTMDGTRSFGIFLYLDDGIQWTTSDFFSGGVNGFGGTEAQVGYDAGDGINFLNVDGSRTLSIY